MPLPPPPGQIDLPSSEEGGIRGKDACFQKKGSRGDALGERGEKWGQGGRVTLANKILKGRGQRGRVFEYLAGGAIFRTSRPKATYGPLKKKNPNA